MDGTSLRHMMDVQRRFTVDRYGWRISKDKEMTSVKKMLANGTTETREPYWREKGKVYDGVNGDIGDTYVEVDMGAQTVYYFKKRKT